MIRPRITNADDWRRQFAKDAAEALTHELVINVMDELCQNLRVPLDGLERYGIEKVATYAAMVARAQAFGWDPDNLRASPDEARRAIMEMAAELVYDGVPVHMIEVADDDPR